MDVANVPNVGGRGGGVGRMFDALLVSSESP